MKKICFFTFSLTFDLSDSQRVQIKVEWLDFSGKREAVIILFQTKRDRELKRDRRHHKPRIAPLNSSDLRFPSFPLFSLFMPTYNANNRLLKSATKMHKLICHRKQRFIPSFFFLHLVDISKSN